MYVAAIIPARGGSKSIPKKNIRELNGKPLIQYSIEYAQQCPIVDYTFVSSDCIETITISQSLGVEVPFMRPGKYASDNSRDYEFMHHSMLALEKHLKREIDYFALLRPTSPLRPYGLIERAIRIMEDDLQASSVRSVTLSDQHPYRQFTMNELYLISPCRDKIEDNEPYNIPRQHLPKFYFQTGDLELIRRSTLICGSVSGDKIRGLVIENDEMLDIDELKDFNLAEKKLDQF